MVKFSSIFLIYKMLEVRDYQKPLKSWPDKLTDFRNFIHAIEDGNIDEQGIKNKYYNLLDVDTRQMIYQSAQYHWQSLNQDILKMRYAQELVKPRQMTLERELDQKNTRGFFAFIIEISKIDPQKLKKVVDIVTPTYILKPND